MSTGDVNNAGDILDGFFSHPSLPFNPSVGTGAGDGDDASWTKQEQRQQPPPQQPPQQQNSETFQPHTPNNTSSDTTTVTSTSSSNQSAVKSVVVCSGDDNTGNYMHVGSNVVGTHTTSPISSTPPNQEYMNVPSMYTTALAQSSHPQLNMQQPSVQILSGAANSPTTETVTQPEVSLASDGSPSALTQGKEVMLERLMACLGESKGMASLQLQLAQVTAPSSPAVSALKQVIQHLEEDIETLLHLRDMSYTTTTTTTSSALMNGAPVFQKMGTDVPKESLTTSEVQVPNQQQYQQQQQQQQQTDVSGAPLFLTNTQTTATTTFSDRGIWSFPESRNAMNKNGNLDLVDTTGSTVGVTSMRQPQPYQHLEAITPQSGQMTSYLGDIGASVTQAYPTSNSALIASCDDTPNMYATSGEMGYNLIDTNIGSHSLGDATRGPPRRNMDEHNPMEGEIVPKFLAFVEFKRHRVRKYECNIDISPGLYVMVDGDRGKDCGLLVQTIKTLPDGSTSFYCMDGTHINADKIKLEKGRVLGVATAEEIDYLHHTMQQAERVALETCRKVCDDMGIKINLQDCEYQFDMEKVSFYFNSEHSVDFRPLVRELYRLFRVRIWMENTNPHVKNAMPAADMGGIGNSNFNEDITAMSEGAGSVNYGLNQHPHKQGGVVGLTALGGNNMTGGRRRGHRRSLQKHTQGKDGRK
ncbi:cell cycle sequence binding phosphoprotein (RBP33), putative [Trypanosoma cruzi marinkellei]|uniref:Cell cycle sequence binding phosphoprotein (RBP33), putative n=1 Tax=Trypanosoma cruzi marinkellei TaxID=85056 RepID=K2N2W1_TRYCR|nr:cell cycle sequence binding phosphoprotein (RBP33), putative [Trypanosoma cruzi marinkellei]